MTITDLDRAARFPARLLRSTRGLTTGALSNALDRLGEISLARRDRTADLGLDVLPQDSCWELLAGQEVGRLAYVARAGVPDVVPVNFVLDGRTVLLRSAPGPKLQAAERRDVVAFEVDDLAAGWSVVVHGRATVEPPSAHLSADPQPWATGPRRHLLRITPQRVTGRRLTSPPP